MSGYAIGVDVGGTFTKAVAVERDGSHEPIVIRTVPTTHRSDSGVATGVVDALLQVVSALGRDVDQLELVSISTTQAVNALLEGDVAKVGILAISDARNARKTRKRTSFKPLEISPGKNLHTCHQLVAINGVDPTPALASAIDQLVSEGAESIAISHAFGVDDAKVEQLALDLCRQRDLPACAGHELSGLYGLELRTQTAAINASILPTMRSTARMVREAMAEAGVRKPKLVMRGDGGSTPLSRLESEPIRTLFSGPAASVAGALRLAGDAENALVIEHGGTSTNIAAIVDGEPLRDYVRVMNFATCVRALDVRVIGIAGGSLMRQERRGRYALGPRSAHQAGLEYACFSAPLINPTAQLISPVEGDPQNYIVARGDDGRTVAVTPTCCAVALGQIDDGNQAAAQSALEAIGEYMGKSWEEVAKEALDGASRAILDLARPILERYPQVADVIVSAGGAAPVFGPSLSKVLSAEERRAPHAPVLSSIGSALSLMRYEVEKTVPVDCDNHRAALEREVASTARIRLERDGAAPTTIEIRTEQDRERGTVRAIASGSIVDSSPTESATTRDAVTA